MAKDNPPAVPNAPEQELVPQHTPTVAYTPTAYITANPPGMSQVVQMYATPQHYPRRHIYPASIHPPFDLPAFPSQASPVTQGMHQNSGISTPASHRSTSLGADTELSFKSDKSEDGDIISDSNNLHQGLSSTH